MSNSLIWLFISCAVTAIAGLLMAIAGAISQKLGLVFAGASLWGIGVSIVIGAVITYWIAKDDYKVIKVFKKLNHKIATLEGRMFQENSDIVEYVLNDKNKTHLSIPHDYGYEFLDHKRRVEIDNFNTLLYPQGRKPLKANRYSKMLEELNKDHYH